MFGRNEIPDKTLLKAVNRRLDRAGLSTVSKVVASVQSGTVTLTGKLKYENQRITVVKAIKNISGVRQVIDLLQSPPSRNAHST